MKLVFSFLLILSITLSYGQKFVDRISLIPQIGISKSILYGSKSVFSDLNYQTKGIYGANFGLLIEFKLANGFAAVSGLVRERKGAKESTLG